MATPLSDPTEKRLKTLFSEELQDTARRMLEADCAENLPFMQNSTPESLERIRFAALKLSGGRIERLLEAVVLAQTDWRDLLVAAGFGNDVDAHSDWWPS